MSDERVASLPAQMPLSSPENRLLDGLPIAELTLIQSVAERVRPRLRQVIYEQDATAQYAYFPQTGVFSLLAQMADGSVSETLAVGS